MLIILVVYKNVMYGIESEVCQLCIKFKLLGTVFELVYKNGTKEIYFKVAE